MCCRSAGRGGRKKTPAATWLRRAGGNRGAKRQTGCRTPDSRTRSWAIQLRSRGIIAAKRAKGRFRPLLGGQDRRRGDGGKDSVELCRIDRLGEEAIHPRFQTGLAPGFQRVRG